MSIYEIISENSSFENSFSCEPSCDTGSWECNPDYCFPDAYDTDDDCCDPYDDDDDD